MIDKNQTVTLIDFGAADQISSRSQTVKKFSGNCMFASIYQLKFMKTSMRDDLISIYQMMLYLIADDEIQLIGGFDNCVKYREENDLMDLALNVQDNVNLLHPNHMFFEHLL